MQWKILKWIAVIVWTALLAFTAFALYRCLLDEPIQHLPILRDFVQGQALFVLALAVFFTFPTWLVWIHSALRDLRERVAFYQPTSHLNPTHIQPGAEWFNNLFVEQEAVAKLVRSLRTGPGALLLGPPRAGKTHCAYEALKQLPDSYVLGLSPRAQDLSRIRIPRTLDLLKPNLVVFLDDVHRFVNKVPLDRIVEHFEEQSRTLTILATCRSGPELELIKDNPTFAAFAKDLQRIFIGRTAEEHQRDSKAAPESCIQAENEHAEASPATVSPKEIPSDMSATSEKTETPAVPETAANARDQVRVADAEQQHDEAALVGSRIAQAQFDLALSPAPPSSESPTDTMVAEAAKEPEAQPSEIIVGGSSNAETGTDLVPASDQQTRLGETEDQRDEAARCAPMITEAHEKPPLVTDEQKHAADAGETELAAIPGASEQAQAHFDRGVMLGQEGRAAEAAQEFREAIRCDPDRAEAHYNLALALSQLGRIGEEERELREAIRCNPDYAEAHYNLAVVLRQQGRVEQAEKEFQEAIRCNPDLGKTNE